MQTFLRDILASNIDAKLNNDTICSVFARVQVCLIKSPFIGKMNELVTLSNKSESGHSLEKIDKIPS